MVVLDSYNAGGAVGYTIENIYNGAGIVRCAQVVQATASIAATLTQLTLAPAKVGLPSATMRYDVYDAAMVLRDWSATFAASLLPAGFVNKTLTLTQSYVCALGEVMWVGCRCTAAKSIDSSNCVNMETDTFLANTNKHRSNGAWSLQAGKLDFTLEGTAAGGLSVPVAMHHYGQMTRIHRG